MTPAAKQENLRKLLRLARNNAEEASAHIANLEAARASAETSLDWLRQAVQVEENAADRSSAANLVDLARYLEGASEKRVALEATRETLSEEIDRARSNLEDIYAEIKKLEHLLDAALRTAKKREDRAEQAKNDFAAMNVARRDNAS